MLTSGSFPIIAERFFWIIVLVVPLISLLLLKRKQKRITGDSYLKPIAGLFFTEIWLWLIAAFIVGFILRVFFGFYIYVNAHGQFTGNERVPLILLILVFGSEAVLILIGSLLHWFMKHLMH